VLRIAAALVLAAAVLGAAGQDSPTDAARRGILDQILDAYVRDGYVYYRALKSDRAKLDGYITQLARVQPGQLNREARLSFWLNAYNAVVLQTVVDHYPIQGRSGAYPPRSIRQIPGAFERLVHQVGGRPVTLDQIEQTILSEFHDPRVYFALGRGSVAGGRLRSEAYAPAMVDAQLASVAAECAMRTECLQIDRGTNKLFVSPIFSWREKDFVAAYAASAPAAFSDRSPIERAVVAFVQPTLLTIEREVLEKNTFQMTFQRYDWSLNDLTGRGR
jgi:hypothetical protein